MPTSPRAWRIGARRELVLDRPRVLAIVNLTPDSFYAASCAPDPAAAVALARRAVGSGADGLDLGGESTRPGAGRVGADLQIGRVVPAIRAIRAEGGTLARVPICVDTTLPAVARAALEAGADAINDVSGATEHPEAMLALAADWGAGLILMHRARPPDQDQYSDRYPTEPGYGDVVREVRGALADRAGAAAAAGVRPESILLDPGLGFGKSVGQNLELIRRTGEIAALGFPILSGASRKSFVGRVASPEHPQTDPADRLAGSLACSVLHLAAGALVFRVHDVAEQRRGLLAAWAVLGKPD